MEAQTPTLSSRKAVTLLTSAHPIERPPIKVTASNLSSRAADSLGRVGREMTPAAKALGAPFKPDFGLSGLGCLPDLFVIPSEAEGSAVRPGSRSKVWVSLVVTQNHGQGVIDDEQILRRVA
jgi:hypothetical protein